MCEELSIQLQSGGVSCAAIHGDKDHYIVFPIAEFACTKHCYWILCFLACTVTWHTHGACMSAHIDIYNYIKTYDTYVCTCVLCIPGLLIATHDN